MAAPFAKHHFMKAVNCQKESQVMEDKDVTVSGVVSVMAEGRVVRRL